LPFRGFVQQCTERKPAAKGSTQKPTQAAGIRQCDKNNEVLDSFKAKGMKAVREKMIVHNLPDEERKQYSRFLDNLLTEASIADTVRIEQEEKVQEAENRKTVQIALNFIKLGLSNNQISQGTGLTEGEIEELRNSTPSV
jgi:hypothetical protein